MTDFPTRRQYRMARRGVDDPQTDDPQTDDPQTDDPQSEDYEANPESRSPAQDAEAAQGAEPPQKPGQPDDPRERMGKDDALFDTFEDGLETAAKYPYADSSEQFTDEEVDQKHRDIEAIVAENHSARQLRIIRRVADVQSVKYKDEFEALWKLRRMGIDPFKPGQSSEMIRAEASGGGAGVPSTEVRESEIRLNDIRVIQLDIARRRRWKMLLLYTRLTIFVVIPTIFAFFYFRDVSTKLYETETQFVIQMSSAKAGTASALPSAPLLTAQDAMNVQAYLQSRDAMLRLDSELGFRAHFSQPSIDPLQRVELDSSMEKTYRVYKKMVKISFDPTEGIVRLRVNAADPETSVAFSTALISYAEQQIDHLTVRLRDEQMKGAREIYSEAEQKMLGAQEALIDLQKRVGTINPSAQGEAISTRISKYEDEIQTKRLELASIIDNPRPNQARVSGVQTDIARLEAVLADLRTQITTVGVNESESLVDLTSTVRLAQVELQTRQSMLQQSLQNLETARIEADRQVRYVAVNVQPIAPDEPTYPRVTEDTILT
ncbi:MAG: capsule biosynthesis protein, partial [Deltaproteobacteria bacterium]